MGIRCECGTPVQASNVNVAAAIATCGACGAVFSIAQVARSEVALQQAPLVIPDAFSLPEAAGATTANSYRDAARPDARRWSYRWFRWLYVFMVAFLLFWDTVCAGFVVAGIRSGGVLGLFTLLLPHVWIGIALSYWTLAHLFNRSTIELDASALTVKSGPIPWRSSSRSRADISGFDVHRSMGNRGQPSFQVRVTGRDRRAKRLLGGLTSEEATYLAQELNEALAKTT